MRGGGEKLIKSLSKKKSTIKRKNNNKYFPLKFSVNFHYQISLNDENTEAKKKETKSISKSKSEHRPNYLGNPRQFYMVVLAFRHINVCGEKLINVKQF